MRMLPWVAALLAAPVLVAAESGLERLLAPLALLLLAGAVLVPSRCPVLARGAAAALLTGVLTLLGHFLADHFALRVVWLYSAPPLPWYLKFAGLWSGDEGILLLLAAGTALGVPAMLRRPGWGGVGALVAAAAFTAGTLVWEPFAPTPAADLARASSLGMNAHLVRVWMAFHPPAVLAAYVLFLLPAGAALAALAGDGTAWRGLAGRFARLGWLTLSLGLATGMWWAYEDPTFGQFWHWDPVQTSVFLVWVAATAHLHLLRAYRPDGAFAVLHPLLGVATAALCLVSLAVTRSPTLASSHRYTGETAQPLFALASVALALAAAWAWRRGRRRPAQRPAEADTLMVRLAALVLLLGGVVAAGQLAYAYAGAHLGWPRPADLKPYFETLVHWAAAEEIEVLRAAYAQWDVNGFALNRWLAPVGIAVGLVGGHWFAAAGWRHRRWWSTGAAVLATAVLALWVRPFALLYTGDGMTSGKTVAMFPLLDALAGAMAYLALAVLGWMAIRTRRAGMKRPALVRVMPLALLHLGAALALCAFLAASVHDTYAQKMLRYPDDFGVPLAMPDGYTITVDLADEAMAEDGGHGVFRAGARIRLTGGGLDVGGAASFRDHAPPGADSPGSVRQMCEIIDYRYARYAGSSGRLLQPLLHRGLWRDVQVWLPAVEYAADDARPLAERRRPTEVPLVLKTFPLVTWLWLGLALLIGGAAAVLVRDWRR